MRLVCPALACACLFLGCCCAFHVMGALACCASCSCALCAGVSVQVVDNIFRLTERTQALCNRACGINLMSDCRCSNGTFSPLPASVNKSCGRLGYVFVGSSVCDGLSLVLWVALLLRCLVPRLTSLSLRGLAYSIRHTRRCWSCRTWVGCLQVRMLPCL